MVVGKVATHLKNTSSSNWRFFFPGFENKKDVKPPPSIEYMPTMSDALVVRVQAC